MILQQGPWLLIVYLDRELAFATKVYYQDNSASKNLVICLLSFIDFILSISNYIYLESTSRKKIIEGS